MINALVVETVATANTRGQWRRRVSPAAATAHHHTLDVPWSTPDLIDTITHATTQRIVPVATAGMAVSSGDNEERG